MGDDAVDLACVVRVGLFVERDANQLMRSDEVVQPGEHLIRKGVPVSVAAAEVAGVRVDAACLSGVPGSLAARVTNVFGGATDGEDVDLATLD